jgi:hypothetical protein
MRYLLAFGRFWIDFIVGDDWRIALMVVVSLTVGALLLRVEAISPGGITVMCTALITAGLTSSLLRERRRATDRSSTSR